MACFRVLFASLLLLAAVTNISAVEIKFFDVRNYGALRDGKTDNANAFTEAWKAACEWNGNPRVYIPFGIFYTSEVTFSGPCKSPISFIIEGTLQAPKNAKFIKKDTWITFEYVDYLTVSGGGTIDGQGSFSWPLNKCQKTLNCLTLPMNIGFFFVKYSRIDRIKSINSKMGHFNFFSVYDFNVSRVSINAPGDSPNTDGIKIGCSNKMSISNVNIATGDDCIAIVGGTMNLDISNVTCGPGHGISVGSLGRYKDEKSVSGITVEDSIFNGSTNGVRIKSWAKSLSQITASDITFQNLQMIDVGNPINIDQHYCPNLQCDSEPSDSQVQIENVKFRNIWGTSTTKVAVNMECSKKFPCKGIELYKINLVHRGNEGEAIALCENAKGEAIGENCPSSCLI